MKKIYYPVCPICHTRLMPSKAYGPGYWFCICSHIITDHEEIREWMGQVEEIEAKDQNVQK